MGLLMLNLRQVDPPTSPDFPMQIHNSDSESESGGEVGVEDEPENKSKRKSNSCATVEEMGKDFKGGFWEESLRVRKLIQHHFHLNGASHVRNLHPEQFCHHGFVMGKASEAGFGNEMYKILSGAALSILLNWSLIIGKPGILPEVLHFRPNVFGEMMRVLTTPSEDVEDAINWFFSGVEPDISLHMRMLMNKSIRAAQAALNCIRKAKQNLGKSPRPRVVIVSDTPPLVKNITPNINKFAEVIHFDYELFKGNISDSRKGMHSLDFGMKDWGPAPGWIAFVDFFLASRAKYAGASADHRRVGTTYAQLIAALAAANNPGDKPTGSNFAFLSSFQGDLLREGLRFQIGWGHVWNRFAGPLAPLPPCPLGCHNQPNQCPFTQLLPPAWWDGLWQFPLPRDIKKLAEYGIQLSRFGTIDENYLDTFCSTRKVVVKTVPFLL
ncbi:PREDICTED: Rhamnogalacturonate lyase family [Prunus dulcis]|uniref:PREDICTED: Rhamnogalacturonate lyase family n=1 Tax=Prunus dulcis TaxID=3755 RepID=A0A5E4EQ91_PRUDU|nr:PREDICTED: Rhamnogalacturonate lyase family [Prunus dulcis]